MHDQVALKKFGFKTKNRVYVIAEIGINHGGSLSLAEKMISSAKRAGADAVKFQTYITEKRVEKNSPIFKILKNCELSFDKFDKLKKFSTNIGIDFFSTPFDEESANYLRKIKCDMFKIASFDVTNIKLIKNIASSKKPVIMSVGMSTIEEIERAYRTIKKYTDKIAILHCISAYPTREIDANLSAIFHLKNAFNCVIGQSDHTNNITIPLYAVAAGAQIIEKHYKLDKKMQCADSKVSITEEQMKKMIIEIRRLEKILGTGQLGIKDAERPTQQFRRFSN